jgi:hypothetical protein
VATAFVGCKLESAQAITAARASPQTANDRFAFMSRSPETSREPRCAPPAFLAQIALI